MLRADHAPVSGRVYEVARGKGPQFYAKWRDADGQHQRRLGPKWTGRDAPPAGYLRRRDAEELLAELLVDARRDAARRPRRGLSFDDVAEEWMRWGEHERAWKPTTIQDHRSALRCHLLPAFGGRDVATITTRDIERWRAAALDQGMTARNANKQVALLHNLLQRAKRTCGLSVNAAADVEPLRVRYDASRYDFYSVEEVMALVRAAGDAQDGALYLTAAFTGLRRGELVALRWRDVDFPRELIRVQTSYAKGALTEPKSGHGRVVPMVPAVAKALAALGQRAYRVGPEDPVFLGEAGGYLDASAMRRRFVETQRRAELKPLRFHDLRHTFGSLAINRASLVQVQHWLGHADMKTTARYLHYKTRADEARLLADAFATEGVSEPGPVVSLRSE